MRDGFFAKKIMQLKFSGTNPLSNLVKLHIKNLRLFTLWTNHTSEYCAEPLFDKPVNRDLTFFCRAAM